MEVRGDNENRSRAIERELHQLGATIAHKLDPEVTHVVFKDGKKSTRTRAEKRQLHLVSVLWLESCKQTGSRVPEKMFPVAKVEEGTPVFARLKVGCQVNSAHETLRSTQIMKRLMFN